MKQDQMMDSNLASMAGLHTIDRLAASSCSGSPSTGIVFVTAEQQQGTRIRIIVVQNRQFQIVQMLEIYYYSILLLSKSERHCSITFQD
jgi:CheY-like chemotaxis protein